MNVESDIRALTGKNSNLYWVVVFACCRELYDRTKHSGCIGLEEAQALNGKKVQKLVIGADTVFVDEPEIDEKAAGQGRGEGLLDYVEHQNFYIIYGTPPGNIVAAETKMAFEVAEIMIKRYDNKFMVLDIPDAFNHLYSGDAVFETSASSTI